MALSVLKMPMLKEKVLMVLSRSTNLLVLIVFKHVKYNATRFNKPR